MVHYRQKEPYYEVLATDNAKRVLFYLFLFIISIISFKKYLTIIFSILICSVSMLHKRFLNINLGIDFCLIFGMLASSKFGLMTGMIIGSGSYLLGMTASMQLTRTPLITIYCTVFYMLISLIYSIIPLGSIYSYYLIHIILISLPFTIGAYFFGAPISFLARYVPSNIIANLLFIQVFGGLLRLMY